MSYTVLATASRILHRLIQWHGLEPDRLFLDCGLDPLKMRDPRSRYPVDNMLAAWRLADRQIPDPCWGLQAGALWSPTDFHALGYAFLASRTLRAALKRLRRYYRIVVQDALFEIEENGSAITVTSELPDPSQDLPAIQDARASILLRMCRDVYGDHLTFQEAAFAHPWRPCSYEEFFGCPIRYDRPTSSASFSPEVLDRYLPAENRDLARSNDAILRLFCRSLSDGTIAERMRGVILEELPSGKPSARDVARSLAMAPRTLQRKLQQEGTTFEDVIEGVRNDLAVQYVRSGEYDLLEVAYLMGFANLPAFSRAYKIWTGRSPSEDLPKP